ncbi:hypothetical protein LCGC14_2962780, partial [marine sediment metagenome]
MTRQSRRLILAVMAALCCGPAVAQTPVGAEADEPVHP